MWSECKADDWFVTAVWGNDFSASRFGQGAFQVALAAVYKTVSGRDLIATTFGKPERGE